MTGVALYGVFVFGFSFSFFFVCVFLPNKHSLCMCAETRSGNDVVILSC